MRVGGKWRREEFKKQEMRMDSLRGEKNGKRGEEGRASGNVEDRRVTRKETRKRVVVKERKQNERREKIGKGERKGRCRQQLRREEIKSQKGAEK